MLINETFSTLNIVPLILNYSDNESGGSDLFSRQPFTKRLMEPFIMSRRKIKKSLAEKHKLEMENAGVMLIIKYMIRLHVRFNELQFVL